MTRSKTPARLYAAFENVRQELRHVGPHRCGAAAHGDIAVKRRQRSGHGLILGHANAADCAACTGNLYCYLHRLPVTDALEHGMRTVAAGELAHALDRLVATLAHHISGAKVARERDPVGMPADDDDPFRAEALRGNHAAQTNCAVSDYCNGLSRADLGSDSGVMARPHHV